MKSLILPSGILLAGFLSGLIVEKVILRKLKKITLKTKWKEGELIIRSLQGWIIFWFFLAGIYGAISNLSLSQSLQNLIYKIILVLTGLSITFVLAKLASNFITLYGEKVKDVLPTTSLLSNITKLFVFSIGILVILQSLGISISPILAGLGIGGLAVALALQDTLSNLFAGFNIIIARQIRPGDYIRLETGEEGYVEDITWRNTILKDLSNNLIVIPNSKLSQAIVKNYYLPDKDLAVIVQVGVSYDNDLEKVERLTIEVAREVMKEVKGGDPEFEPFIRYHTFSEFSINFSVIMKGKEFVDQYLLKHEFIKRLHKRYREEGILIPYPIKALYLEKRKDN